MVCRGFLKFGLFLMAADDIVGPVVVSALLFFAVLANFVIRGACHYVLNPENIVTYEIRYPVRDLYVQFRLLYPHSLTPHRRQQKVPIPGMDFLFPNSPSTTLT